MPKKAIPEEIGSKAVSSAESTNSNSSEIDVKKEIRKLSKKLNSLSSRLLTLSQKLDDYLYNHTTTKWCNHSTCNFGFNLPK